MCAAESVADGLEVRDEQGRIVQQGKASQQLQNLFYKSLIVLLVQTDIHSIAESRLCLQKASNFAARMISIPVNAVKVFALTVLAQHSRKSFHDSRYFYRIINPQIPILIFPGLMLIILSRKLSCIFLRL